MISKSDAELFLNKTVVVIFDENILEIGKKGKLTRVSDTSLVIEFDDGRDFLISLDSVKKIREVYE